VDQLEAKVLELERLLAELKPSAARERLTQILQARFPHRLLGTDWLLAARTLGTEAGQLLVALDEPDLEVALGLLGFRRCFYHAGLQLMVGPEGEGLEGAFPPAAAPTPIPTVPARSAEPPAELADPVPAAKLKPKPKTSKPSYPPKATAANYDRMGRPIRTGTQVGQVSQEVLALVKDYGWMVPHMVPTLTGYSGSNLNNLWAAGKLIRTQGKNASEFAMKGGMCYYYHLPGTTVPAEVLEGKVSTRTRVTPS
jgi:hypothetical protein